MFFLFLNQFSIIEVFFILYIFFFKHLYSIILYLSLYALERTKYIFMIIIIIIIARESYTSNIIILS